MPPPSPCAAKTICPLWSSTSMCTEISSAWCLAKRSARWSQRSSLLLLRRFCRHFLLEWDPGFPFVMADERLPVGGFHLHVIVTVTDLDVVDVSRTGLRYCQLLPGLAAIP